MPQNMLGKEVEVSNVNLIGAEDVDIQNSSYDTFPPGVGTQAYPFFPQCLKLCIDFSEPEILYHRKVSFLRKRLPHTLPYKAVGMIK